MRNLYLQGPMLGWILFRSSSWIYAAFIVIQDPSLTKYCGRQSKPEFSAPNFALKYGKLLRYYGAFIIFHIREELPEAILYYLPFVYFSTLSQE